MIHWIPLNPISAPEEIEENVYLISTNERIISATHDAINRWFCYESDDHQVVIPYRYITHYAEFNFPSFSDSGIAILNKKQNANNDNNF